MLEQDKMVFEARKAVEIYLENGTIDIPDMELIDYPVWRSASWGHLPFWQEVCLKECQAAANFAWEHHNDNVPLEMQALLALSFIEAYEPVEAVEIYVKDLQEKMIDVWLKRFAPVYKEFLLALLSKVIEENAEKLLTKKYDNLSTCKNDG
jgi:hypothetical protein